MIWSDSLVGAKTGIAALTVVRNEDGTQAYLQFCSYSTYSGQIAVGLSHPRNFVRRGRDHLQFPRIAGITPLPHVNFALRGVANTQINKCKKHFVKKWGRVGLEEHVHWSNKKFEHKIVGWYSLACSN